jgi:ABC-type Na+ efflux pump permease subunit
VQATFTLPVGTSTSTLPATATSAAVTATTGDTATADPALLATQAAGAGTQSPQNQAPMDYTGIIVTLGAVAIVLIMIFWRRLKQK